MIKHLHKKLVPLLLMLLSFQGFSQNLLNNGNFETGTIIGFFSNGAGYVRLLPPFSGTTTTGNWAFTNNPQLMNTASFVAGGDHTTGTGLMLVFDGNMTGGQQNFWEAGTGGSGVCGLTIGATYTFSYWIKSVYGAVAGTPTPADIRVQILNANSITLVSGATVAPPTASGWQQVVYTFRPLGNCVNIKLYNNNTTADGNDFAIDDMSVTAPLVPLSLVYTATNSSCPNASNGSITAAGSNGVLPYVSYNLTGPIAPQSNATGFFSGLPPGTYSVSVTDSAGTTVAQPNIVITEPSDIVTSSNTAICLGASTTMTVSGGVGPYNWTALPADPTLVSPSANPTVSPTQTTVYTVTPTIPTIVNLVSNGNFSSGNVGFSTDYQFLSVTIPAGTQKSYGIVANANSWFPGFSPACVDHTSGSGLMMVVDGSVTNAGNDIVWGQNVAVVPGQNYTFTYWLQTISAGPTSIIRATINGNLLGLANAPITLCGWTQFTYTWNSGVSTTAQIRLFDNITVANGNDFALDDIAFTTNSICTVSKSITITVDPSLAPVISCGTATLNTVSFNWAALTGATAYTISYSVNNGPTVNAGSIVPTTFTVTGLTANDSVQLFVTPTGTGCFAVANATCIATTVLPCPVPLVSVTQQPTCAAPTGTIVFTSPINSPLPIPTNLFISKVSDADAGSLTYVEVFNGTGATVNLANYKIRIYNNGNPGPSLNCDFPLSGNLLNNDVVVVAVGSATNLGGVVPDLTFAGCPGVNTNDNIRLATIANVEFDLWGRTDGVDFTPVNSTGYTYTRKVLVPHPSMIWNPTDWTTEDPEVYTNFGNYAYLAPNYQYSVVSPTYQASPTFSGLVPNTYNVTVRDLISGCTSAPISLTVNSISGTVAPPSVLPLTYCPNATAVPLTATTSPGGTLNWYGTNATGGTASATAPIPATSGAAGSVISYYVSQTVGGCESTRAVLLVYIGRVPLPTYVPFLFCDGANTTTTSVAFDFNNVRWQDTPTVQQQTSWGYSYSVAGGPLVTGTHTGVSNFNVPVTAPGQAVTFTVTWNGICTPSQTITCFASCVTTPVLNITNPAAVCAPNTVDITLPAVTAGSTGGGTLTYWTNASATIPLANPNTIATSGTYYIRSALGGCVDINPVVVTINPSPSLIITNPSAVCSPSTVNLTLPAITLGSTGGGTLSYWTNATATTALINPNAVGVSGTYYIKSTVGTCTDIEPVTVTINPSPSLIITNPTTVCTPNTVNITLAAVTAGSTGGGTLSYWTNAGATSALANPNAIASSGTYYIRSVLGLCSDIELVTVTIGTTPVLSITNPIAVCAPNTVNITLAAVTAGSTGGGTLTYWTNAGATISLANPSAVATSGTYYIRSTVGTCFDIKPVTVIINPTPSLTITNPAAVCSPNTVDITLAAVTAGSTGGGTLTYWTNAAATISLVNPNTIASSGTYYIKSTLGSCFDIEPVVVTIAPTPSLTITNPAAVCAPNTVDITQPSLTTGSTGGGTLTYWTNAGATIPLANPSAIATSGTYYIKNTVGTCFIIGSMSVIINPSPSLVITNPIVACATSTVDITLPAITAGSTGGGVLTYWTNATATAALLNPNAVSVSGTYYIRSSLGACFDIEPVTVVISNPILVITNPIAVCSPNTVDITQAAVTVGSSGGGVLSYWNDAAATNPLTNPTILSVSGTYYIKSTVGTCFDIEPVVVSIIANFTVNNPQPLQECDPSNDGLVPFDLTQVINSVTGGNLNYTVSFHETYDDALVNGTFIPSPLNYDNIIPWLQTIYIRVASTTSFCSQIVTLQLIVNPTPEATVPPDYELCDTSGLVGFETFNLTTVIPQVLGSTIDPALTVVYFYENLSDAQSNTTSNAIVSVGGYTNSTAFLQTLYVVVQTIATGCFDIVELNLVVNPLPNSLQPNYPQYSLCDTDPTRIGYEVFDLGSQVSTILLNQTGMDVTFYYSLGDAQNGTRQISLLYENEDQYVQTIGIRITNSITGCYVVSTMDIRVEPLPTLIPQTVPYTICDDNQDGVSCGFDLLSLVPSLLQGGNYTLSFYETPTDAQIGSVITAIDATQPYCNILPFVQLLYVRAVDNITGCVSVTSIELNVDPSPIAPVLLDDIVICDYDSNTQDGQTLVDLTQRTADVLAQQPLAAINYVVSYYATQFLAQQGTTGQLIPFSSHLGRDGDTIWVRVENVNTQCFNVGSFQLKINAPLVLTTPAPLSVCDADANPNNQYFTFDLTIKNLEIAPAGEQVTYYPSYALALAGVAGTAIAVPTGYTNIFPAVQTLGAVVTTAAGCTSVTTLDIRVLPIPTPRTNPPALPAQCDVNSPGDLLETFNLTLNEAYIANGDPNLSFHYYANTTDATLQQNEIITPATALVGADVIIRVENNRVDYLGNNCYVLVTQALRVNPLPTVEPVIAPFRACDDNADGFTIFNLSDPLLAPQILGLLQAPTAYTISYYLTAAGANPVTNTGETPLALSYTNTTADAQTIYIRVTNNTTGCVNATGVLDLVVEDYATATAPPTYQLCDEDPNAFDGIVGIDLNQFTTTVLGTQDPAVFLVSYYDVDPILNPTAMALTPAEVLDFQAGPDTDRVWVKVENSSNSIIPFCSAVVAIDIIIERRPNPVITTANAVTTICVDYVTGQIIRTLTLNSGITNPANYTFEWYEIGDMTTILGTDSTYTVGTASAGGAPRTYVVHVTNNFANTSGCDYTSTGFQVIQSGPAVVGAGAAPGYVISNAFSDSQSITVNVVGFGIYEYSLDDGPRQTSNVFVNVSFDPHIIHVWDMTDGVANSCDEFTIQFANPIDYPHYFTPNGDGIHDNWNIRGLQNQAGTRIYIFDRYGKLLKQISAAGPGWDGTYNGHLLPADDYWFTVEYVEPNTGAQTQFKAHFTLKR